MTIYSKQIVTTVLPAGGPTDLYTVPSGATVVIRSITCAGPGGAPNEPAFGLNGSPPCIVPVNSPGDPNSGASSWFGYHVLQAGDVLQGYSGPGSQSVLISGYYFAP